MLVAGWKSRRISSTEEMMALGEEFAKTLSPGAILLFYGDLGAGKTTFVKGLAKALCGVETNEVQSPTFTYLNIYEGSVPLYHFDLYRLENAKQFYALGFEEYLGGSGVAAIEWAERLGSNLPEGAIQVEIKYINEKIREVSLHQIGSL
ncbi:MAG: tRNA (adenosine(37)-N6)-threonylcarbamoyltransferase complex ATPase subunit type 1 TsaE [Candidatus Algichlamydia australiensis]|nr:tRNA (adenosine(37)-N6)-threonylcarbamoyltransferase complex ATPase subunit type 1 TsaE [Chlamydiales bacterium]